jgi:hypothetical protein
LTEITRCPHTHRPHKSRGLCDSCYNGERVRLGREVFEKEYPTVVRGPSNTYQTWLEESAMGFTLDEVAKSLGIKRASLISNIRRNEIKYGKR